MVGIVLVMTACFGLTCLGGYCLMKRKKDRQFWELQKQLEYELYQTFRQGKTV